MPTFHRREADIRLDEIDTRLNEIAGKMEEMSKFFDEEFRMDWIRIRDMAEKHEKELYGNGKPGTLKTVDRLEQLGELMKRIVWLLGATLIGAFLLALFNHLIALK